MAGNFKPNIYPIMYWGLLYGVVAGLVLTLIKLLSAYISFIWFPVFLAGVIWGGYRNYKKQKQAVGPMPAQPVMEELKDAAKDILGATQDMVTSQQAEVPPAPAEPTSDNDSNEPPIPPAAVPPA